MTTDTSGRPNGRRRAAGAQDPATQLERTACPRCGCDLVPVHRRHGSRRAVVALTCPEPYCGHTQGLRSTSSSRSGGLGELFS